MEEKTHIDNFFDIETWRAKRAAQDQELKRISEEWKERKAASKNVYGSQTQQKLKQYLAQGYLLSGHTYDISAGDILLPSKINDGTIRASRSLFIASLNSLFNKKNAVITYSQARSKPGNIVQGKNYIEVKSRAPGTVRESGFIYVVDAKDFLQQKNSPTYNTQRPVECIDKHVLTLGEFLEDTFLFMNSYDDKGRLTRHQIDRQNYIDNKCLIFGR